MSRGFDHLLDRLLRRKAEIAAALAQGSAGDYSAYRELVGQYAGLQYAQEQLESILRAEEQDE